MTFKIQLKGTDKFFLADFADSQPIEAIYRECFQQLLSDILKPSIEWMKQAKLVIRINSSIEFIDPFNSVKRWGDYKLADGSILEFSP